MKLLFISYSFNEIDAANLSNNFDIMQIHVIKFERL